MDGTLWKFQAYCDHNFPSRAIFIFHLPLFNPFICLFIFHYSHTMKGNKASKIIKKKKKKSLINNKNPLIRYLGLLLLLSEQPFIAYLGYKE